jgi:hypothetical protein
MNKIKYRALNKSQIPSTNIPACGRQANKFQSSMSKTFGDWNLVIGYYLEFGIWNLGFGFSPIINEPHLS